MTFPVDPGAWAGDLNNPDNTPEGVQTHIQERQVRGFSRYDWYNFDTYLYYLIVRICKSVDTGLIPLTNSAARRAALEVRDLAFDAYVLTEQEDQLLERQIANSGLGFSFKELEGGMVQVVQDRTPANESLTRRRVDLEAQATAKRDESVKKFFTKVFPYLPYSPDRYYTPVTNADPERYTHGFSKQDATVIRSYLTAIMIEGMQWFASPIGHSYVGDSPEAWAEEVRKMMRALHHLQAEKSVYKILRNSESDWERQRKEEYVQGMNILIKRFSHLWD